jgi:hypothetical protein
MLYRTQAVEYHIEIYRPGDARDPLAILVASTPFASISPGNLIRPGDIAADPSSPASLVVDKVEHILWTTADHIVHKVCVFTREAPEPTPEPVPLDPTKRLGW